MKLKKDARCQGTGHPNEGAQGEDMAGRQRAAGIAGGSLLMVCVVFLALPMGTQAASWTQLTNLAPASAGTMMLLSDGTVMVQGGSNLASWIRLVPDSRGSYINGTWAQDIAPMNLARLYFASNVLPSGQVWVLGGEYSGSPLTNNWTNTGEIWDPIANTWSQITNYPATRFGDDPSILLPGGKILAGDLSTNLPQIYDTASDTWSAAGNKVYNDRSDEESWVKLGDGRILTYDLFQSVNGNGSYAEVYDPVANAWSSISPSDGSAGGTLPLLSSSAMGFELGPALRLQDGRILVIGATAHTALYDPTANNWAAGPDTPGNFGAVDAPAAELPNGHIVYAADNSPNFTTPFHPPTKVFEFNPIAGTTTEITPADSHLLSMPSFPTRMALLPTGQVLFSDGSAQLWVYTGDGGPTPSLRPGINNMSYNGGGVFTLTGTQLNGQSAGAGYGDDVESDSNFPIVRLTTSTGNVYYCRTFNWSSVGVDDPATQTVNFTLNSGVTAGNYALTVVGAGIPSFPVFVNITQDEVNGL